MSSKVLTSEEYRKSVCNESSMIQTKTARLRAVFVCRELFAKEHAFVVGTA
jgi:hypothetical protein